MVANPGANMPAPFAIPPTVYPVPCATEIFGTVSVVMIDIAAASPPSALAAANAESTPANNFSIGRRSPIRPVEQTTTSPAPISWPTACANPAACSAVT